MADVEIRKPVPLRTLHGIELAAMGTWKASTGKTTFTDDDLASAVAALECPGVRNPVIKLGHMEADSDSGVRWDGEPAVGWVANMRLDGAKLIGDLTGLPAWLADADENGLSVLAAAYPDRSIEIYRPFECQIGHLHPSVITALSLLGVAPPGVGVLKSMQDVYAVWTVSAEELAPVTASASDRIMATIVRAAAAEPRELSDIERRSGVDFDGVREDWDSTLDIVLEHWGDINEAQRSQLAAQIAKAVDTAPDALGDLKVDSTDAAETLLAALVLFGQRSADRQVVEVGSQGLTVPKVTIGEDDVKDIAEGVAAGMAASTASSAGRYAAQALGTGDGKAVAAGTLDYLSGLTDRFLRDQIGGALSAAASRGRMRALQDFGAEVEWYASERNDINACAPCKSIDGTRFDDEDQALSAYGGGKYVGCAGGARCRGQLIAVVGSDKTKASAPRMATTIRMNLGGAMPTGGAVKASVSVEDISRKYYEAAGYSMYITAMHVDPLELIAADDSTGKFYRVPVTLSGDTFEFGEPQEVAVAYQDVAAASAALPVRFADRKAALAAAGKNPDGSDRVAPDVTPAGAAIRKAMSKAAAETVVLETEVPTAETETPDADTATGPTTTHEEASVDAAMMREALGLKPDASDAEVAEAFSAQVAASAPAPTNDAPEASVLLSALPKDGGAMLIDPENYKTLVKMAAKGQTAFEQMQRNERDTVLRKAMDDGRFPVARLSTYQQMWDKDPAATKAYIELMPKQSVPTMASGFLGAEVSQNETDIAYEAMYGKAGA